MIESEIKPKAGDLVLLQIKGGVGKLVWLLQALNGDFSKWTHAGVMVSDNRMFEAQPGGAVLTYWSEYSDRPFVIVNSKQVSRNGQPTLVPLELKSEERGLISDIAINFDGTPYNWTTYFYLAAYRVGIRPKWLKERVQDTERLICSQAADEIYTLSHVHLFSDGRMPCDVTPGDLARLVR